MSPRVPKNSIRSARPRANGGFLHREPCGPVPDQQQSPVALNASQRLEKKNVILLGREAGGGDKRADRPGYPESLGRNVGNTVPNTNQCPLIPDGSSSSPCLCWLARQYDFRRSGRSQALERNGQPPLQAWNAVCKAPCMCSEDNRSMGEPCGKPCQQSGFRSMCVHEVWHFAANQARNSEQRPEILHGTHGVCKLRDDVHWHAEIRRLIA